MRIIKQVNKEIVINNITYPVLLIYKTGKKNISYRFKDNCFIITTPISARYKTIEEGLIKFAPKLMSYQKSTPLFGDDYIYILGNKYEIKDNKLIIDENNYYEFINKEALKNELKKYLLNQLKELVEFYKVQMNINVPLKVRVKEMKTRYGSFSRKTNGISFGFELIHYDIEMSKAVVVHELSHYYVFDHSQKFYDLVLKNYPNYYNIHGKLRKGITK